MAGKSILIIDDDAVFLSVLSDAFNKRGYRTGVAENIAALKALLVDSKFDFAVVDLKIDKESGLDCVSLLKQHNAGIRMLILTGYSSIATAVSAIKLGAYDYACKPMNVDEILSILEGEKIPASEIADDPVSVGRLQWEHIQRVLEANAGNISETARSLGMHRRTLQRKLQKRPVRR
ncbi:MAG: two-component system response regulator [SAR86 cluster bacterium]|uniref:Two-component system response regulator n=1 Tax=SAR86 cluster bacterium TaxID=2030880 RepID=A0A2A5CGA2_9GAMM|nr:MAG: two-component system response regulator [SAR86 cluster bacterium]